MKRKKDDLHGESRYIPFDELQDCNEQELKKSGWQQRSSTDSTNTEIPTETVGSFLEKHKTKPPILRSSPKDLPVRTSNQNQSIQRSETKDFTSWRNKEKIPNPVKPVKKEQENVSASPHRIMMIGSLSVAMALLIAALLIGSKYTRIAIERSESEIETNFPAEEDEVSPVSKEEKVIFVRQYDDASGILTKPELYAKCADTVVSIVSKNEHVSGIGSGFILSEDGYIATAYHVVEGMTELTVLLADQSSHPATLICGDPMTDLAVLKIDANQLSSVTFGESAKLLTGETVVAIGTPASKEYAGSLCSGEISYVSRTVKIHDETGTRLTKKMILIQTNAPVNPGNSGCPLFNEYGQVVGVITMKLGHSYSGIGFAIPSDGALPIFQTMIQGGTLTDELLSTISIPAPKLGIVGEADMEGEWSGVRVLRFSEEFSESASPLKIGDLILKIDQYTIATSADIYAAIQEKNPNDTVSVTVLRAGQHLTFDFILKK